MTVIKSAVIIGAGPMGSAIAMGLKASSPTIALQMVDPDITRRNVLINAGISTTEHLPNPLTSEAIIIAIPPQAFGRFSKDNPQLEYYTGIIISVMAGINLSELISRLKVSQVCRAMPNLPCAVSQGVTVLIFAPEATQKNNILVRDLFSRLGLFISIENERLIDDATALIGGGPAYISYFAAALIEYALLSGFDKTDATLMVTQLLRGTAALLDKNREPPMRLCEHVMTAKGTTEQAINFFNRKQVRATIVIGLKHARLRAEELGRRS
ncbi:hypothetical protein LRS56_09385 [Pseudomonas poae]|nr:hypothetical protein LRS56_09385 [Pseudomonas poae]